MAEFVQKRLEDLLPELEQLERVQLFTKEEVRAVIKRRKEFEYRIQRKQKAIQDFTRYIEYERNLLQLVWKRRDRTGYKHKKAEIDLKIVSRIQQLYRIACIRFSGDASLFLAQVEFCKQMRQLAAGSRVFSKLLRTHSNRPDLWVLAARYEMEECNSPDTARKLLLRALRLHPESSALWTASFRMELEYVKQLRQRQDILGVQEANLKVSAEDEGSEKEDEDMEKDDDDEGRIKQKEVAPDPVLRCGIARAVALQSLARLPEADPKSDPCQLLTGLLAVCRQFEFAADLESELQTTLRTRFPARALTYDTLARAELAGGRVPSKLRTRLQLCAEVYEQGVSEAPAAEVYPLYLSSLVETARAAARHRHLVLPRLQEVMQRAQSQVVLPPQSYTEVASLLCELGMVGEAAAALKQACDLHPSSAMLWIQLIETLSGDGDAVCAAFEAAAVAVPDSAPHVGRLWLITMQWASAHRPDYVSHVFSAAAARGAAVLRPLKSVYLRWLAEQRGMDAAREMFDEQHVRPPVDAQLFTEMLALEERQQPPVVERLRRVYRAAARHVGSGHAQLWMDYLRFERERGDPKLAAEVYRLAVKSLDPEQADKFVEQHTLMAANMTDCEA